MVASNFLLLTVDTLRADRVGCYGHPAGITPNIDRLAESGALFEQAITGGSWTQAAFPPLLTSSAASKFGGCLGPLAPERPSPIEALAGCGYRTFGISSSPLLSRQYGYDRGFSAFENPSPRERDPRLRRVRGGERLLRRPLPHRIAALMGKKMRPARLYITADEIFDAVRDWLVPDDQPFFGWIHYMDVHWPYHRELTLETPEQIARAWRDIAHLHRVNWKHDSITPDQRSHYTALYEEAVRFTDGQIGRLLDHLERTGLRSDTAIIVVSDHGEEFLERGRWGHFEVNLHDEIIRVPLIFHLPDEGRAVRVRQQVSTFDIMPTLLDLAGCPFPQGVEGASLAPLWRGDSDAYRAGPAISEMWRDSRHIIAVRTQAFKYLWDSHRPAENTLFHLETDPGETENVAQAYPEVLAELKRHAQRHREAAAETATVSPAGPPEYDDAMVRRLRDLGYLE